MTPRTLPRPSVIVALLGAIALIGTLFSPPLVVAQANDPIYLRGNPMVRQDRVRLLREEFRERRHEIRENQERIREAKQGKREKGEEVRIDPDYAGLPSKARLQAPPFGTLAAPANTRANDKTGDAANAGQAEQSIAFLGQNGLCAWNDGQGFVTPPDGQGYGFTTNGGATWTDGGVPLKQGTILSWDSDPVVTVNERTGDFYYTGLTTNSGTNDNAVAVARGHFSGAAFVWDAATIVFAAPIATQALDKQWMAADSSNGNLYLTWTTFTATGGNIFFSRSTNNGVSWSAPVQMNGSWENGLVSGSRPMVGPNGEVYVIYGAIGPVDADSIKIAKSTNAGASFAPAVVAMTEYDNYFDGAPGFNRPRAVTFPSGAVDRSNGPNRGRVYLGVQDCVNFYADAIGGGTNKSEVEPNSGFLNATPFTINQTLRGSLTVTTDQDWYKFPATQGTTYIFFVDSLRTTSLRYTMRLYCPNDTTVLSRLALSGAEATTSALNSHSLIVWTAPTTNTYYLRMIPVTVSAVSGGYRIRTGSHTPVGSDVARDTRDVVVASSANGVSGWSARVRVNDDLPLYDNWLPEVAVACDGQVYAMWFDWRDTPASCFGGSNIYLSRSTNAGATWAANQAATTAPTPNWTQVAANIAPNQGDYNGMYGGDAIGLAMADGRLGDADVFTARLATDFTLSGCPGDQVTGSNTTYSTSLTLGNLNPMFGNTYDYTVSVNRNWPGYPAVGSTTLAALGSGTVPVSIVVPDTAGGVVRVCVTVSQNGACVKTCCFNLTIQDLTPPSITLVTPATGEVVSKGSTYKVSWTESDNVAKDRVVLWVSYDGGATFDSLTTVPAGLLTYTWTVPAIATNPTVRMRAVSYDASGNTFTFTTGNFTIEDATAPVVTVTSPNGGNTLMIGATEKLAWTATDNVAVDHVDLFLSRDGGVTYETIAAGLPGDGGGSYVWTVTGPPTSEALFKVVALDGSGNSAADSSDLQFEIRPGPDAVGPGALATDFDLTRIHPNPSRGATVIEYTLPREAAVRLSIVDVSGREVALLVAGRAAAGRHEARWLGQTDHGQAPAGLYFVRYQAPGKDVMKRMVLVK